MKRELSKKSISELKLERKKLMREGKKKEAFKLLIKIQSFYDTSSSKKIVLKKKE